MTISVDGRWLDDEGWRADLIDGFGAVADRIGCIYGHAVATRNWGPAAGNCGADDHTETWYRQTIGRDRAWLGLPRNPVWLAWLGPPYRHLDVGRPHGAGRLFVADDPAKHADTPPRQQLPVADHWLVAGQGASIQRAPSVPDGL